MRKHEGADFVDAADEEDDDVGDFAYEPDEAEGDADSAGMRLRCSAW